LTPYVDFLYFALLLYPVLPAVLLGLLGWLRPWYVLLATVGMLLVQYGNPFGGTSQLPWLGAYAAYETAVVLAFAWTRSRLRGPVGYYAAVVLVLLPLVLVKAYPLLAAHGWLVPAARHPAAHPGPAGQHPAPATGASKAPTRPPQTIPGLVGEGVGFLGISYITFRFLDVVLALRDGLVARVAPASLLAYAFFFPCVSSGPIDRYRRFLEDLHARRRGAEYLMDVDAGLYRVAQGFLYKFLVARQIYVWWLAPLSRLHDPLHLWLYAYVYTFYLFFDFAGYSAFAIGIGNFFGIRTPENFRAPFLSRDFKDFWNRWHITLSWYLRDHIYMRFVLGAMRGRWLGNRYLASYIGYLLTMGAMGCWHGLQPHYIAYGLYHAVMLIGNDYLSRWNRRRRLVPDTPATRLLGGLLTFHLVCFGMLLFSGRLFT
jgi:membrane protein involved in D-alanine export